MKYILILIFLLLIAGSFGLNAQPTEPEIPLLYLVTIDPESGNVIIIWYSSPSTGVVDYYKIVELQPEFEHVTTVEISFPIYVPDTMYAVTSDLPFQHPVGYSVVAVNDIGGGDLIKSQWDNPDSTIFLELSFDSCQANISLAWNDYNNWRGSIDHYNIYRYRGPGMYELLTTLQEGTNTLDLQNVTANQDYDIFVEAVHVDGRRSTSNRASIFTGMTQVPIYINADYATISPDNTVELSFTIEGSSGLKEYRLLRSNSFDGEYSIIQTFNVADNHIVYTDEIPFTSSVVYYRLEVVNNCGIGAIQSNRANNIILNGTLDNLSVSLTWNEYIDWLGYVHDYKIIRKTGWGIVVLDTLGPFGSGTSNIIDDISNLIDYEYPYKGYVCYSAMATENINIYGLQGISLSNQVCFSINPGTQMPNAFIPNDDDQVNRVFEPVFSFLPDHYDLVIYNRLGLKIWEGSVGWDGKVNGKYVPEGVYVYYLRVFSFTSEVTEFNGKVTVLYR